MIARNGVRLVLCVAAGLYAGCAAAPTDDFNSARIEALCGFYDRCGTLTDAGYANLANCRTDLAAASKASASEMTCDSFSQSDADACVAAWMNADCTTPPDLTVCEGVCSN